MNIPKGPGRWVSDAEQAELRAEIARLRAEKGNAVYWCQINERRAEAAEAQVAAVRALIPSQFEIDGGILIRPEAVIAALSSSEPVGEAPLIPRDILTSLFRALVYVVPGQLTNEQINQAWSWLEEHNHYEEMGQ